MEKELNDYWNKINNGGKLNGTLTDTEIDDLIEKLGKIANDCLDKNKDSFEKVIKGENSKSIKEENFKCGNVGIECSTAINLIVYLFKVKGGDIIPSNIRLIFMYCLMKLCRPPVLDDHSRTLIKTSGSVGHVLNFKIALLPGLDPLDYYYQVILRHDFNIYVEISDGNFPADKNFNDFLTRIVKNGFEAIDNNYLQKKGRTGKILRKDIGGINIDYDIVKKINEQLKNLYDNFNDDFVIFFSFYEYYNKLKNGKITPAELDVLVDIILRLVMGPNGIIPCDVIVDAIDRILKKHPSHPNKSDLEAIRDECAGKGPESNKDDNEENTDKNKSTTLKKSSINIIFTGAPGTGKTYLAKKTASKITKDKEENIGFVQFHPSYDYTDFVEGLRPVNTASGIGFELKNGIFKEFCIKALAKPDEKFVFIIDEINRAEISKVFGELFFSIDPDYKGEKGKVITQFANIQNKETIFDSNMPGYFYVPENVSIIGTMNDIDRSVESFDFAMRRRFAWMEIKAEDRIAMWKEKSWKTDAERKMTNLNDAINKIEGLGSAFHIGPAYFLKLDNYGGDFEKLWNYHLKNLLYEYLRGRSDANTLLEKLKNEYNK